MPRRNRTSRGRSQARPGRNLSSRARAELTEREKARHREAAPVVCPRGKRGYSEHVAKAKLEQYQRDDAGRSRTSPTTIYECPLCGSWHLTSRPVR